MTVKRPKSKPRAAKLLKYYNQRYNLFSRFDDGIQMDDESWYSVTPENIAKHIAERVISSLGSGHHLIVDGFCGVGGNLIQFANYSPLVRVIGCDIDANRIKMAKHNAKLYGVQDQCDFILGNFLDIMKCLKGQRVDAVFLSPPWGGCEYLEKDKYSLTNMRPNGFTLIHSIRKNITNNIAFLMPRNIDQKELKTNLLSREHQVFDLEENRVGTKIKTITVYFGDLVDSSSPTDNDDD